jgi:hypothetical protein
MMCLLIVVYPCNVTGHTRYFVESRTLGPLLRAAGAHGAGHAVVPEMATRRLLEGCSEDKVILATTRGRWDHAL